MSLWRLKIKALLDSEVMKYADDDVSWSRLQNQYLNSNKVASELREFRNNDLNDSANRIASEGKSAVLGKSFAAGAGIGGAMVGGLVGPIAIGLAVLNNFKDPTQWVNQINGYRNKLASTLGAKNTDVNAHFHPHLSQTEFNAHVKKKTGGMAGSLKVTFKSLLKKM